MRMKLSDAYTKQGVTSANAGSGTSSSSSSNTGSLNQLSKGKTGFGINTGNDISGILGGLKNSGSGNSSVSSANSGSSTGSLIGGKIGGNFGIDAGTIAQSNKGGNTTSTSSTGTDTNTGSGNTSLSEAYGGTSSSNGQQSSMADSEYEDTLSQLARQGNYEAYFKKATQNANINRLAQKYLNNTLKQQGLESTGEGAIGSTALSNAYLNAQANALSDYNTQEQSITESAYDRYKTAQDEAKTEANTDYSNWTSMLQNASSSNTVDEVLNQILADNPDMDTATANKLKTYATSLSNSTSESSNKVSTYESLLSNASNSGNLESWYTKNVVNNDDLTDDEKSELARYYESIKGDSTDSYLDEIGINTSYSAYTSADELKQMTDNGTKTGSKLSSEIDAMVSWVTGNKPNEGAMFHLTNNDGNDVYIYYDPSSGSYYRLTSEQASKYTGTSYTAYKGTITNNDGTDIEAIKAASNIASMSSETATKNYGFPSNPKEGDTYSYGGRTYKYTGKFFGYKWVRQ